jgi:pimeloyl-ACP methyl ester carboxylesterase
MGNPVIDFTGFRARWLHHELGLNLAIPVMPLHGPRKIGRRSGDGYLSANFIDVVHAQAQAVSEVRALIRWLRQRGAPAVGLYGISLGAYTAALVAALEPKLDCVIAGIPTSDYLSLLRSHVPRPLQRIAAERGFDPRMIERVLRVVSPLAMKPRISRERLFLFAGRADRLAGPEQARALWRHWDRPRLSWYDGSHISFLWEKTVEELVLEALGSTGFLDGRTHELRAASSLAGA